jgi:type III pantothenate kinase
MFLAIDIGNTHIAAGLFRQQTLSATWRVSSVPKRTEDETWVLLESICRANQFNITEVTGLAVSSVVPDMDPVYKKMANKYLGLDPLFVDHTLNISLKILYNNPSNVGADRICNAVAAFELLNQAVVVVDFGTATTFDIISDQGEYLGGIIAPGIETSAKILHQQAARLPLVGLSFPASVIGTSTETSMQSGLLYGAVEMIDGLVRRIHEEMGENVPVIATGGLSKLIINRLETIHESEPFLTLKGLYSIYRQCRIDIKS